MAHGDPDFLFDSVASVQNDFERRPDCEFETNGNVLVSNDNSYTIPQSAFIIFPVYGLPYYFCILCNDPIDSPVFYFDTEGHWFALEKRYESVGEFLEMLLAEATRDNKCEDAPEQPLRWVCDACGMENPLSFEFCHKCSEKR